MEMMKNKKLRKSVLALGIAGSILMGAGDFLMMWGNPTQLPGVSEYWATVGVAAIPAWRNLLSVLVALPALFCYAPALLEVASFYRDSRFERRYRRFTLLGLLVWLSNHLYVAMALYNFAWLYGGGHKDIAYQSAAALADQFAPLFGINVLLILFPFMYFAYSVARGRTALRRLAALHNPLLYYVLVSVISSFIPKSAFQIAFENASINSALLLWFCGLLFLGESKGRLE